MLGPNVAEARNATVLGPNDVDKQKLDEARQLARSMISHPVAYSTIDHVEKAGDTIVDMLAERVVLVAQVNALRDALMKVLDARDKVAKARMRHESRSNNFSNYSARDLLEYDGAMLAASDAESEARVLLATLKVLGA